MASHATNDSALSLGDPIRCERLDRLSDILDHGFFTRQGGYSRGIYTSLNAGLGTADDPGRVARNRALIAERTGAASGVIVSPYQSHSDSAVIVESAPEEGERPHGDAVVTKVPGLAIGVTTADCGPVLFADPVARIVAAAHAGWRGAIGGILESTVAAMQKLGARMDDIIATLGPTISQPNYEVGPEFAARFLAEAADNARFLVPSGRDGHHRFDLPAYIVSRLDALGVRARWTGHCTYERDDLFFSCRRAAHRGEPGYGCQLSTILIRE